MPRHVCANVEQLKDFCEVYVTNPDKYVVISTDEDEVILEPLRSTRPVRYAYLEIENAEEVAEAIATKHGLKHLKLKSYDWKVDIPPGVAIPSP